MTSCNKTRRDGFKQEARRCNVHRILVVDDEHLTADTLSLILKKNGFDARTAYSTDEALACARDFEPQLLLCDITMPGRNGLHLMVEIGRKHPDCKVLVLTGYYANLPGIRDQEANMPHPARVLTKPCDPVELLREAGALLAGA